MINLFKHETPKSDKKYSLKKIFDYLVDLSARYKQLRRIDDLKKYLLSETAYLGKDLKLVLDKYPDKIKKKDLLKELELI